MPPINKKEQSTRGATIHRYKVIKNLQRKEKKLLTFHFTKDTNSFKIKTVDSHEHNLSTYTKVLKKRFYKQTLTKQRQDTTVNSQETSIGLDGRTSTNQQETRDKHRAHTALNTKKAPNTSQKSI